MFSNKNSGKYKNPHRPVLEVTFAVTMTKLNQYYFFFNTILYVVHCFLKNLGRESWVSYMLTTKSLTFMLLTRKRVLGFFLPQSLSHILCFFFFFTTL